MDSNTLQVLIAMVIYMAAVIVIGFVFAKKANANSENYFLGGRSLGPWVTAMSAEASDMSGWLLMGLPGVAYWCGVADAAWTAIGLAVGTYFNWLIVSKRLRRYSIKAGNAITLPDFFSNRFKEKKKVIMTLAALFILIFFTVYAASCFVTCGKLFSTLFGASYQSMVVVGAIFVLLYTILGGFLAESASDFMQSIVMIVALVSVVAIGVVNAGGFAAVIDNAGSIPGFLDFFGLADPVNANGQAIADVTAKALEADSSLAIQAVSENGVAIFGAKARPYGILTVFSMLAWGLGYFGMPQVLLRFMAIREEGELKRSRRIAMIWVIISLAVAVFIGIVGRVIAMTNPEALEGGLLLTNSDAENIFIQLSTSFLPPIIAGFVMAGILAATISSSDSYLLIAASAVAKNIYQGVAKKNASDKSVMTVSRITLLVIALIAMFLAFDENSVIFQIVSFAWAGFGATFGPLMLFSLFWKRTTRAGAIAGMVGGAGMVFLWKLVISTLGGVFAIYELLPAFIFSSICIVVISLLTKKPSEEIEEEFEAVKLGK
ncbi:MAG: sodium/proline symporter [Clostridia bacterium]|nr:sodium/proline symporter [Clostridia bacterium]